MATDIKPGVGKVIPCLSAVNATVNTLGSRVDLKSLNEPMGVLTLSIVMRGTLTELKVKPTGASSKVKVKIAVLPKANWVTLLVIVSPGPAVSTETGELLMLIVVNSTALMLLAMTACTV